MDQEFDIKSNAIDKKIDEKSLKSFREESAFRVLANDDHFFHNSKALIKYSKGLFNIKIICEKQPNQEVFNNFESIYVNQKIQFSKSENTYEISGEDIRNITQTFTDPFIVNFRVTKFSKLSDNLKQFYRVIIPIPSEPNFEPFETYKLHIYGTVYYGLVKLQIEDKNYELYHFNNKDLKESYIAIDGTELSTDTEFEEATRTILKTFSLFTGNLYQSELYFYRTEKLDEWWKYGIYKFENKHQNVISDLQIIHPYKFKSYLEHFNKEKFADIIGLRVSAKKYTIISNNIHKNYKIERIIHLLLEANKSKSLILRCSTYSVALETLSNIICDTKNNKTKPITDDKLAELIINKFKEIIKEYDFELSAEQVEILNKKVYQFNAPLNTDKLKLAFKILGIELNENDISALKGRNLFLHGSTPFKNFEEIKENQSNFSLFSSKMHLLLTCLLLKYLGFNGAITNHYAFGKSNRNEEVDEHFFKILKPINGW